MSSFPSTASICISENSSIVNQNHILSYFPSKSSFRLLALQERLRRQFCLQLVAGTFTRLFSSFVRVYLYSLYLSACICIFSLDHFNWKFSDARTKFTSCVHTAPRSLSIINTHCPHIQQHMVLPRKNESFP